MNKEQPLFMREAIAVVKQVYEKSIAKAIQQAGEDFYKRRTFQQLEEQWWNTPPERI